MVLNQMTIKRKKSPQKKGKPLGPETKENDGEQPTEQSVVVSASDQKS
jgi:hypothetical protein